jgi:hypothetical protein
MATPSRDLKPFVLANLGPLVAALCRQTFPPENQSFRGSLTTISNWLKLPPSTIRNAYESAPKLGLDTAVNKMVVEIVPSLSAVIADLRKHFSYYLSPT